MKCLAMLGAGLLFSSCIFAQELVLRKTLDKLNNSLLKAVKKNNYQKVLLLLSQGARPENEANWREETGCGRPECFYECSGTKFYTGCLVLKDVISPKLEIKIFKVLLAASEKESFLKFSRCLFEKACNADRQDLAILILQLRECYGVDFDTKQYGKITMDLLTDCKQPEKWVLLLISLGLSQQYTHLFFEQTFYCSGVYFWAKKLGIAHEAYEKLIASGKAAYELRKQEYNDVQTFILNRCEIAAGEGLVDQTQVSVIFVGAEEFHKRIAAFDTTIDDTLQNGCTVKPFPKEITNLIIAYQGDLDFYQMMQCMKYDLAGELKQLEEQLAAAREEEKDKKVEQARCLIM